VRGTSKSTKRDGVHPVPLDTKDWAPVLKGVDTVIHCAALAHVESSGDEAFIRKVREYNVHAPHRLAKQAKDLGVKRFVFLSSVKALGESTPPLTPYTNRSEYLPEDLYGESKRDAELALKKELSGSQTELVIIRPPLVYGPNVKGNFKALISLANRNLPLPLGALNNKRSLVALDNLVSLIVKCVQYESQLNATFLVSDDYDVSTRELLEALTLAQGKKPIMWSFPVGFMRLGAALLGKKNVADRLFGNLQLDISHTKQILNWEPPLSFHQAIKKCINPEVTSGKLKND
jgi:UDP-glucose 4-epimerase